MPCRRAWTCASGATARSTSCASAMATPRRRSQWSARRKEGGAPRSSSCLRETFTSTEFDFATLEHRLRELAFLNSGVRLELTDARGVEAKTVELHYEGGVEAFVRYLD